MERQSLRQISGVPFDEPFYMNWLQKTKLVNRANFSLVIKPGEEKAFSSHNSNYKLWPSNQDYLVFNVFRYFSKIEKREGHVE